MAPILVPPAMALFWKLMTGLGLGLWGTNLVNQFLRGRRETKLGELQLDLQKQAIETEAQTTKMTTQATEKSAKETMRQAMQIFSEGKIEKRRESQEAREMLMRAQQMALLMGLLNSKFGAAEEASRTTLPPPPMSMMGLLRG